MRSSSQDGTYILRTPSFHPAFLAFETTLKCRVHLKKVVHPLCRPCVVQKLGTFEKGQGVTANEGSVFCHAICRNYHFIPLWTFACTVYIPLHFFFPKFHYKQQSWCQNGTKSVAGHNCAIEKMWKWDEIVTFSTTGNPNRTAAMTDFIVSVLCITNAVSDTCLLWSATLTNCAKGPNNLGSKYASYWHVRMSFYAYIFNFMS